MKHILGIDIGGSGIKSAVVDVDTGELVSDRIRYSTPKPATPENVARTVAEIVDHFKWQGKIGCAFPTVVIDGKAKYSSNLHPTWIGEDVQALFRQYTGVDALTVINDADAAGLAEIGFGSGQGKAGKVVIITLGTGIGSGLFYNGLLIPNIEMGHMYNEMGQLSEKYAADSVRKNEDLNFKKWGKRLNSFLDYVDRIFSPDHIIIGGGISKKMDRFKKYIKVSIPVYPATKLNNAGIIGAALHVEQYLETETKH